MTWLNIYSIPDRPLLSATAIQAFMHTISVSNSTPSISNTTAFIRKLLPYVRAGSQKPRLPYSTYAKSSRKWMQLYNTSTSMPSSGS